MAESHNRPRSPLQVHNARFSSFDELGDAVTGWGFDWVQLDRGSLDAHLRQVETPELLVSGFRMDRGFHQRGSCPPGLRTFGVVDEDSSPIAWRDRPGTVDELAVFPVEDAYEFRSEPGFGGVAVSVADQVLRRVAGTLGRTDPLDTLPSGRGLLGAEPGAMAALRQSLARLQVAAGGRAEVPLGEPALRDLEFEVLGALVAALTSQAATTDRVADPSRRARGLRVALAYIEEHAGDPPSIEDVCRGSGVSYRTSNYAFHDHFGVTPKQYLQALRLHRARQELLQAGPRRSVIEVAGRWGFWHMGQFAADYRKMFGELPSETLERQK